MPRLHIGDLANDRIFLILIRCAVYYFPDSGIISLIQIQVYFTLGSNRLMPYTNEGNRHSVQLNI